VCLFSVKANPMIFSESENDRVYKKGLHKKQVINRCE
jgi:hypothetical protein